MSVDFDINPVTIYQVKIVFGRCFCSEKKEYILNTKLLNIQAVSQEDANMIARNNGYLVLS